MQVRQKEFELVVKKLTFNESVKINESIYDLIDAIECINENSEFWQYTPESYGENFYTMYESDPDTICNLYTEGRLPTAMNKIIHEKIESMARNALKFWE